MKGYIINADFILGMLFGNEEGSKEIKKFLIKNENRIYALDILKIELSIKLNEKVKDLELIEIIYGKFLNLPIKYIETNDSILKKARGIVQIKKITFFNACYEAAALLREMDLK